MKNRGIYLPEARYVGPDEEVRFGKSEYAGGRIYPVDPAAHARLREALGVPEGGRRITGGPQTLMATRIAENLRRRREELLCGIKPKRSMRRTTVEEEEMDALTELVAAGAPRDVLERWRREHRVNGNSFKRLLREIAARLEEE